MLSRRSLLVGGAAAGALLVARPAGAFSHLLGQSAITAAGRASRLFPSSGLRLVHADLHNHSLLSDGDGDPDVVFRRMRENGLDVGALTDHSTVSYGSPICSECTVAGEGSPLTGIDEASWMRLGSLANAALADGQFVAMRGFEWSSPTLGHVNVWFSDRWTDPLHTGGATAESGAQVFVDGYRGERPEQVDAVIDPAQLDALEAALAATPTAGTGMQLFYEWLGSDPARAAVGGGSDGLAGFNHPGREPGRFGGFVFDQAVVERVVSIEVFNRGEDYLFEGVDRGLVSPIVECLDAGWRVGLLGVSDEHGTNWGDRPARGRAGLWVDEVSRDGVRRALVNRRFFSTTIGGLRVDVSAKGQPMGATIAHDRGAMTFLLDVDKGSEWWGKPLEAQVLQTGATVPEIVGSHRFVVARDDEPPVTFTVDVDRDRGDWLIVRITDPERPPDDRAPADYRTFGGAIAYASPFFLDAPPAEVPELPSAAAALGVAALGVGGAYALTQRRSRGQHVHDGGDGHDDHDGHECAHQPPSE